MQDRARRKVSRKKEHLKTTPLCEVGNEEDIGNNDYKSLCPTVRTRSRMLDVDALYIIQITVRNN